MLNRQVLQWLGKGGPHIMAKFELSTTLPAPVETVWHHLQRSAVMTYVAHPRLRLHPIDSPALPERWIKGQYRVAVYWFGVIPLGTQTIGVSFPPVEPPGHALRDDGHSTVFRCWSHLITLAPRGPDATLYTDTVEVAARIPRLAFAGVLRHFFKHRQKRWHTLVQRGFDTSL